MNATNCVRKLSRGMVPALIAMALAAGGAWAQSADPVYYTVGPVMEGRELIALAVDIRFAGDADGETLLHLPGRWAGTDSLWRQVEGLRVDGATSVREIDGGTRVITHPAGAPLAVRYRVRSAYGAEPGFGYQKALPVILPDWFFFHGEGVFALPGGRQHAPARFAWRGFPAGSRPTWTTWPADAPAPRGTWWKARPSARRT